MLQVFSEGVLRTDLHSVRYSTLFNTSTCCSRLPCVGNPVILLVAGRLASYLVLIKCGPLVVRSNFCEKNFHGEDVPNINDIRYL